MARPRAIARTLCTAALGAAALTCTLVPTAGAAFGIAPEIMAPASFQAGGHQNLTIRVGIPGNGLATPSDPEDIDIDLPPGLVGDPNAVTKCTLAQATAKNCPAASQVGVVTAVSDALIITDMVTNGTIHVMESRGDEPARLFIKLVPDSILWYTPQPIVTESPITLRSPGDFGLRNSIRGMPKTAVLYDNLGQSWNTIDIHLKSMTLTLYGTPPNSPHGPFLTNPTECKPIVLRAAAKKYGSSDWVEGESSEKNVTGCESLPFDPSMSASPSSVAADQPTALSVTMGFPQPSTNPSDLGQSTLERAEVLMPEGFALSASSGTKGLEACTDDVFAVDAYAAPTGCPELSKIGTVAFTTPLVGTVNGTVFVGEPKPGATLRLLIYAELGSIRLKLTGRASTDEATGRITTIFDVVPPIPFTAFTLNFRGGPNAIIKAPSSCGAANAVAKLWPSARPDSPVEATATVTTTDCPAAQFAPKLDASVTGSQAGGNTGMTMEFSREDADDRFDGLRTSLPPGLLGRLSSVERCALSSARIGVCPDASKVGTVSVLAGTGLDPLPIEGPVYLTEPETGAVAGLAIIVPAKVGPIDLGAATVMAKMTVRADMGIDVVSEPMPRILGGVPLFVRKMTLKLDRDGFMFNASSCAEQQIKTTLVSTGGREVSASSAYKPTGCESVPFAPKFSAVLTGDLKKPALTATMEPRPGDATMASMKMMLPEGLGPDTSALRNTCQEADFIAGACPAKAKIGSATAVSPIIPDPLSGSVYLVNLPGEMLPGLAVTLKGLIDVPLVVRNSLGPGNRLISSVPAIPDVPLSRFDLKIGSLLQTDGASLCKKSQTVDATFTGHNGAEHKSAPTLAVTCEARLFAPLGKLKVSGSIRRQGKRGGALRLTIKGKRITGAQITVPKALGLKTKAVRRDAVAKAGSSLLKRSMVSAKGGKLTVSMPAAKKRDGVSAITLDLSRAAIRGKLKRGKKIVLRIRTTHTGNRASTATLKLKVR